MDKLTFEQLVELLTRRSDDDGRREAATDELRSRAADPETGGATRERIRAAVEKYRGSTLGLSLLRLELDLTALSDLAHTLCELQRRRDRIAGSLAFIEENHRLTNELLRRLDPTSPDHMDIVTELDGEAILRIYDEYARESYKYKTKLKKLDLEIEAVQDEIDERPGQLILPCPHHNHAPERF